MTIPVITNSEIPLLSSQQAALNLIRASITAAGFPSANYDTWDNTNWVVKYVWNASKAKGFVYLHFFVVVGDPWSFGMQTYQTWDIATHAGTIEGTTTFIDLSYIFNSGNYKLKITSISHPELKGFIWQQEDRFGSLYFARPAVIVNGYGYDDINFSLYMLLQPDCASAYQAAGALNNPFNDNGYLQIESWAQLKYKIVSTGLAQIAPSPRVIAPDNSGFIASFSSDIGLCSSYGLDWRTPLVSGAKTYLLLRPKDSSGLVIATN